jgi:hypothetical protein
MIKKITGCIPVTAIELNNIIEYVLDFCPRNMGLDSVYIDITLQQVKYHGTKNQ